MQFPRLIDDTILRCRDLLADTEEPAARVLQVSQLEHRILLNAAPVDAAMLPAAGQSAAAGEIAADDLASLVASATESVTQSNTQQQTTASSDEAETRRRELVFVDMGVSDPTALLHELWALDDADREFEIVLIKSSEDGIRKISDTLADQTEPVDAIHILSHGSGPAIQLGSVWLDADTLESRRAELSAWSPFLSDQADLLFYGCELAESEAGRDLLRELGEATGTDLAASTDDTGAAALGGDWVLEFRGGDVEAEAIQLFGWQSLLATPVGTADYYHIDAVVGLNVTAVNGVLANDTGTGLQAVLVSGPSDAASFTLNADGSFSYTPVGQSSSDTFTYVASDGVETSAPTTVRLDRQPTTGGFVGDVEELALSSSSNERTLTTSGGQAVAALPDGRYVVVYSEDVGGNLDVFAQRFDAAGNRIGTALSVGTTLSGNQDQVVVSAKTTTTYPGGLFTVAYQNSQGGVTRVHLASYNFDTGASISTATLPGPGGEKQQDVAVDHLSGGEFVVVHGQKAAAGSSEDFPQIRLSVYPNTGVTPLVSDFAVTNVTDGQGHFRPTIATTSDGGFAIAWHSNTGGGTIHYRKFDSSGLPETGIVDLATGDVADVGLAEGADGNLLVSFVRDTDKIVTQVVNSSGVLQGSETVVRTYAGNTYSSLQAVALSDGTYVIGHTINYAGGGTDPSFVRVSATAQQITEVTGWNAPNKIRNDDQQTLHMLAQGSNIRLFWNGAGNGASNDVQTRLLMPYVAPTSVISGHVGEDFDGDGTLDGIDTQGVTVRLWQDDGDATIDAGDTFVTSTTTAADGTYSFTGLADGDYYVTFDSRTVASTTTLNSGFTQADVWASQTVFDENAVTFNVTGNPTASRPNRSDDATSLLTSNHVAAITVAGSDVTNVDAGFSFRVVDTTADGDDDLANGRSVQGSLRQFIQNANALSGSQQSYFNIDAGTPGLSAGVATITLASALPTIEQSTLLDARDQAGYSGTPLVQIDAAGQSSGSILTLNGDFITLTGFALLNGPGHGIEVNGSNAFIHANYIGVDATGLLDRGMAEAGIYVTGADAQIGGPNASHRNVISGNSGHGIEVVGATGTRILGNTVGLAADNATDVGNSSRGVVIRGGSTNITVGQAGSGNIISGNSDDGVSVSESGNVSISSNLIGLDITGQLDRGNQTGLIVERNTDAVTVSDNVIAGNSNSGVLIQNATSPVTLTSNVIGLAADGDTMVSNGLDGVFVDSSSGVIIGGVGEGNVISGNRRYGIQTNNSSALTIAANVVGLNAAGLTSRANSQDGIRVTGSTSSSIGGVGVGNIIGGNDGSGLYVTGSSDIDIVENHIGTDATGLLARGNANNGIDIELNTGAVSIDDNVIGDATSHAIRVADNSGGVTITSNLIGLGADGSTAVANNLDAVLISDSSNVDVGAAGSGNVIANTTGASATAIQIDGSSSVNVVGNLIGMTADQSVAASITGSGIRVATSSNIQIGGDTAAASNVIGNGNHGIHVLNSSDDVRIQGNVIGTNSARSANYANSGVAIRVRDDVTNILVGGTADGEGNHIEYATVAGIQVIEHVAGSVPSGVSIYRNTFGSTVTNGIDLVSNFDAAAPVGPNANDALDSDVGVSGLQNKPVLTSSRDEETRTRIAGVVQTTPLTSVRIEVFAATNGLAGQYGPGEIYLGTITVTTDASGNAGYVIYSSAVVPNGDSVTATATNLATGETSEFALNVETTGATLIDLDPAEPGTASTSTYAEGQPAQLMFPTATVSDSDSPNLASATLTITNAVDSSEQLAVDTTGTSISATWSSGSHTLTLSGPATQAEFEAVLQTATYVNNSGTVTTGDRTVRVSANDGFMTGPYVFATVTVSGTNAAPVVTIPASQDVVREGLLEFSTAAGNAITLADADAGSTDLELTIVAGNGSFSLATTAGLNFTFGDGTNDTTMIVRGSLAELNAALDGMTFEPTPGFDGAANLVISLDDLGNSGGAAQSDGAVLAINVLATNTNPTVTVTALNVDENQPAGASVGKVTAVDPDPGDAVTYSLANDAGGLFTIDSVTGDIRTTQPLDFETAASHIIAIQVQDRPGITVLTSRIVTVNDLPEGGLPITLSVPPLSVAENQAVGTTVGTVSAVDPNIGATLTFSLDDDAGGLFSIDGATGVITANNTLNHETSSSRSITIRATSSAGTFDTETVSVSVTDVNETPSLTVSSTSISEAALAGSVVMLASVADVDAGDSHLFSLDDDAGGLFEIDSATGVIRTTGALDHEASATHSLTVRVTDAGGRFDATTINITVTDANEAPVLAVPSLSVNEGLPPGTVVGTVTASDVDAGEVLTFSLDDDAGGLFAIDGSTGVISTTSPLDHEAVGSQSIVIRVTDTGGQFDTATVNVTVTDTNEPPDLAVPPLSVSEGLPAGTVVGTASATDVDAGDGLTFSLDDDAGGLFVIDSATGVISTTSPLDHEAAGSYSITVRVADTAGDFDMVTANVAVIDVNEAPALSVPVLSLDEGLPAGAVVGTATAIDTDAGEALMFSLDDDAGGRFTIDPSTGVIATTVSLDHDVASSHSLIVRVTDAGGLSDVGNVDVSVQPVNQATQIAGPSVVSVVEDQPVVIGGLNVTNSESDEVLQARWSITSGDVVDVPADFTGTVSELNAFLATTVVTLQQDFDQPAEVQLQVVDELDRLVAFDVFIDVIGVNDAPVAAGESFFVSADDILLLDYDDLLANDDDVDSPLLTIEIDETINGGFVFDDGLGVVFVPDLDFAGVAELSYRVFDGEAFSEWVVAAVTVDASQSLPFFDPDGGIGFDSDGFGDGGFGFDDGDLGIGNDLDEFDLDADGFDPFDEDFGDEDSLEEEMELDFDFDLDVELDNEFEDDFDDRLSETDAPVPTPDGPIVEAPTIRPATEELSQSAVVEMVIPADTAAPPSSQANAELIAGLSPSSETMIDQRDANGRLSRGDGTEFERTGRQDGLRFRTSFESSTGLAGLGVAGFGGVPRLMLEQPAMFEEFDRAAESVEQIRQRQAFVAGSAVVSGTALTIGYAVWTARGGYLLASLMSAMPTWKFMDPLLVLSDFESWQQDLPDTDISLEELIRDC